MKLNIPAKLVRKEEICNYLTITCMPFESSRTFTCKCICTNIGAITCV